MQAVQRNKTWEHSNLPEEKKAIGLKCVYKSKFNPDGSLLKKKARIVAKGYNQLEGIDFEEAFSPVTRMETVRLFLAVGIQRGWCIYQLDVKMVFLNGELKEEVYVKQRRGSQLNEKRSKSIGFTRLSMDSGKPLEPGIDTSILISSR